MNKEKIYQLLNEKGVNASMVARSLEVTPQLVHRVITEGSGSARVAKAIAHVCELPFKEMFPYYFRVDPSIKIRKQKQEALDAKLAKFA